MINPGLASVSRCHNPTSLNWKNYGARGIRVCEEWHTFNNFYIWAVSQNYQMLTGLQIDRMDCNGDYEPSNCRWVDKFVNARNKRNTVMVTAFGITQSLPDWLEDPRCSITYATLWSRLRGDWTSEGAITAVAGSSKR